MYNHILFLLYWLINSLVIFLLSKIFPSVSLGNTRFFPVEAAIYGGFWLTFVIWMMWDFMIARKARLEPGYVAFFYFLIVNILGIWLVSRFQSLTGIAISGWWVLMVALVINILQRTGWRIVTK